MKKLRLLLLDAGVVILLHRLGLWKAVVDRCELILAGTVARAEAVFYEDDAGERHEIDLSVDEREKRITVVDVPAKQLKAFRTRFGPVYLEKLDDGEAESLAYLVGTQDPCRICSADKIVYRVLGNIARAEDGISLEEVLQKVGLAAPGGLPHDFCKPYREFWTAKGFQEKLMGIGEKPTS